MLWISYSDVSEYQTLVGVSVKIVIFKQIWDHSTQPFNEQIPNTTNKLVLMNVKDKRTPGEMLLMNMCISMFTSSLSLSIRSLYKYYLF